MRRALLALVLAACAAPALPVTPAAAGEGTVWLCKPGAKRNPCVTGLTATVIDRAGETERIERTRRQARKRVDCFYAYPTVSAQRTTNSNLRIEASQRAVASFQASRFSQTCRVWAPMYRQFTLRSLGDPGLLTPAAVNKAYRSLRAGWRDYLRNHNRGRGVVFVSHSQGTFHLRRLIREEVEPRRAVRRRLVSALLVGGGVTVRRGSSVGGDFARVRACRSADQLGCVIAYSAFAEAPPENAIFGRAGDPELEVLCTNPAALAGGSATLRPYALTRLRELAEPTFGPLPEVGTPWITQRGTYRGECEEDATGNWLEVRPLPGARDLTPLPDARWGVHQADVNIALGDLTAVVRRQATEYLRRR